MTLQERKEAAVKRLDVAWKLLIAFLGIFVTIAIGVTGYTLNQVAKIQENYHAVDLRVTRIEANRFTSADAAKMLQAMMTLEKRVAALPQTSPPNWFLKQVERLESRVSHCEHELQKKNN